MKILIVGSGGVGGYLSGKLLKCGKNIHLTSTEKTENIIKKKGLKIIDVNEEFTVYPEIGPKGVYDVAIVTTKSYDLNQVIEKLKPHVDKESVIMPVLNGVGHFSEFESLGVKIVKSCIYILSNKKERGIIHKKTPLFYLCTENDEKIKKVFEGCDLKVKFSSDIQKDIWKKYLFIATFATLQSYYMKPTGWIMEHKRDEAEKFIDEVIKIAEDYGIDLKNEKENVIRQALNIPYESKMSMQIDFENSNKTECDNITGFLARKSDFISRYYEQLKQRSIF